MPGPYHEESIYVAPFNRSNGSHVAGHESHALVGTPIYVVLYRPKDVRAAGGTREKPKNERHGFRTWRRYRTDREAERARRRLMRQGFHAIVEKINGRSPDERNGLLEGRADEADLRRSVMRE